MTGNNKPFIGWLALTIGMSVGWGCKDTSTPHANAAGTSPQQARSKLSSPTRRKVIAKQRSTPKQAAAPSPSVTPSQALSWKRHMACMAKHSKCPKTGSTVITRWFQDRPAALSLTYDDSMPVQYKDIYPIQKRYGFKATYFLYTRELLKRTATNWGQSIRNWKHWRRMQAEGNELGSHSVSHPYLSKVPFAQAKRELVSSCRTIKKYVPKALCETIAYPYGDSNAKVRRYARKYYLAARQAKRGINPANPPDMMNIRSVIPMMSTNRAKMEGWIRRSLRRKGWTVWMFHGAKGQGWEPLTLKRFDLIFKLIKRYEPKLWVGRFGDVSKYILERQKTRIKVKTVGAGAMTLSLHNSLDIRFKQPLTLRIALPSRWNRLAATQGKKRQTFEKGNAKIKGCPCLVQTLVNAVPNQGTLTLKPSNVGF